MRSFQYLILCCLISSAETVATIYNTSMACEYFIGFCRCVTCLAVLQKSNKHLMDNQYQPPLSASITLGLSYESYFYLILILHIQDQPSFWSSFLFASFSALLQIYGFTPNVYACLVNSALCSTSYTHIAVLFLFITKIIHDAIYDILIFPGSQVSFPDIAQISWFEPTTSAQQLYLMTAIN